MGYEREARTTHLREKGLGREIAQHKDYSEKTAVEIDEEVKTIVFDAYSVAKTLLQEKFDLLDAFAKKLLEKESLDGQEIEQLIQEYDSGLPVQA